MLSVHCYTNARLALSTKKKNNNANVTAWTKGKKEQSSLHVIISPRYKFEQDLRVNVLNGETYRGNSKKINSAHILGLGTH